MDGSHGSKLTYQKLCHSTDSIIYAPYSTYQSNNLPHMTSHRSTLEPYDQGQATDKFLTSF